MGFSNVLRKRLFWSWDNLTGSSIKKHNTQLGIVLENPFSNQAKHIREVNLRQLLTHASNTTPFYKNLSRTSRLGDYPVINKKLIQDNFEAFRSDMFKEENLFRVSTSGSTGVPFFLLQDKNKRKRNTADVLFFSSKAGYEVGNLLFELEVWRKHNTRSWIKNSLQNTIQFDITQLTDERIEKFLQVLGESSQPKNILGFPSALEQICRFIDSNGVKLKIESLKSVIANSEYLNPYTRNAVTQLMNCPVYSRYSSEELGIIAHQTDSSGPDFEVNWGSYHIEVLKMDKDEPVANGNYGRLVITDLFNYAMPMIRYDTGDIAMFKEDDSRFLKTVEGRKMDMVYDTQGNMLSSYVVYTKFYPYYQQLHQYQFLQTGAKDYKVKLNIKGDLDFGDALIASIKEDFGADANVSIECVDEIPSLSSGKRKKVVNLYQKP